METNGSDKQRSGFTLLGELLMGCAMVQRMEWSEKVDVLFVSFVR